MAASQSRSSFCGRHRFAPYGVTQHALCKIAYADPGLSAACTPQPLRVLRAGGRRPCAGAGTWSVSQLLRKGFRSAASPCILCMPRPPSWPCPASRALALRGLPVRPQGAPSEPRQDTPPVGGGLLVLLSGLDLLAFCYLICSCLRLFHRR